MAQSNHTPGPWAFRVARRNPNLIWIYQKQGNPYSAKKVAMCNASEPDNARLMAAAPDLNQCLVESTILIRDALALIDQNSTVAGCLRKQLEFNESTLKKAKGE